MGLLATGIFFADAFVAWHEQTLFLSQVLLHGSYAHPQSAVQLH